MSSQNELPISLIIEKYELPVCVQKGNWSNDFYFRIERIQGNRALGKAYKGEIHKTKLFGAEYEYTTSDYVHLYGKNTPKRTQQISQDTTKTAPAQRNEAADNIELPDYIPGETSLYVSQNGKWKNATFVSFSKKDGKDVIYISCDGETSFYAYPSEYIKESYQDVLKQKAKEKQQEDLLLPENFEITSIIRAYQKRPASHECVEDYEEELLHERSYHAEVSAELNTQYEETEQQIRKALKLGTEAREAYRQAFIDEREYGYDPFNFDFRNAELMQQESDNNQRIAEEKQHEIKETRKKPYFARIDCGPYRDDLHTAYLGNSNIGQLVVDWRNSSVGNAYYYSDMLKNSKGVCLALKRVFTFVQENLSEFSDEINTYGSSEGITEGDESSSVTDSLFLSLLKLSRDNQTVHDIVSTIQQNQYDIITSDFSQNALINGCAGSGKTMILYHRLSYIAYNDPSNFFPQYVFAVTPSDLFVSLCNDLIDQLHLNEIHNMPYEKTLRYICEQYYDSNGITRYIDKKKHTEESCLGTEGLSEREYLAFKKIVSSVSMNPADFTEWFVDKINKILKSKGLEELDELEVYKRIALKKDLSVLVDNQIRKEPFTLSTTRKKRELDKRTGTHVEIDETVVTNRPRELTDYSWENFEYTFRSNPSRWKLICKYSSELNQLLSDKPQMDDKGKNILKVPSIYADNEHFLDQIITLLVAEKALSSFQTFFNQHENDTGIYSYVIEYALEKTFQKQAARQAYDCYRIRALAEKFGSLTDKRAIFFVDEFQNYSPFELETLQKPFENAVLNLFGDYDQKLDGKGIQETYFSEKIGGKEYEIAENYRNAFEITEYINKVLDKNMLPIGLHGTVEETEMDPSLIHLEGRTAIIVKSLNLDVVIDIQQKLPQIHTVVSDASGLDMATMNLIPIHQAKGLEFDTVYVLPKDMTDNEKYVAYTRALKKLVVLS